MNLKFLIPALALITWLASVSGNTQAETAFTDYASFPASQTHAKVHGFGAGLQGDVINYIIITPSATNAGSVTLFDDGPAPYASIPIYNTGTLSDLKPVVVPVNMRSRNGAFYISTGASETVIVNGRFQ